MVNLLYHRLSACQQKEIRGKNILFGTRFAGMPFWQPGGAACHFGSSPTVVGYCTAVHASHPKGERFSPLASMASYCDRRASTRSRLPGWPTFTIMVSSPPNMRGSTLSALVLFIFFKALRLNLRIFSERIVPPSTVDLSQGIAIPTKHIRA